MKSTWFVALTKNQCRYVHYSKYLSKCGILKIYKGEIEFDEDTNFKEVTTNLYIYNDGQELKSAFNVGLPISIAILMR